jgi:hypothetical protein
LVHVHAPQSYCFFIVLLAAPEPVVLALARHCWDPFLSFSQAAIVWYLQFIVVPGPFRQNFPLLVFDSTAGAMGAAKAKVARAAKIAIC